MKKIDSAEVSDAPHRLRFKEIANTLRAPVFTVFFIPNLLRGITFGITNSIALIALSMGYSEGDSSKLPIMCAAGYVTASLIYHSLVQHCKLQTIGLVGAPLLSFLVFLPTGNKTLFLFLFFVGYTGRIVIDYVIPIMVVRMIDPEIAGTYNAWRTILLNILSIVTVYLIGKLLGNVSPSAILISCAAAYSISILWYCICYSRIVHMNE